MPTIKDVANKAGVGIATVSRVINNSGYVGKETRNKVERVIKELNYSPNEIARSMLKQKNKIVAFIIPSTSHLFFGQLLDHLEEELFKNGYKMMLCNSFRKLEKELVYLDMLNNNRVDAVILLSNSDIEKYLDKSLPIISFDRYYDGIPFVSSENYKGGRLAAKTLIDKGCKNLLFIGDDAQIGDTPIQTEVIKRQYGFIDYANEQDVNVESIVYPLQDYSTLPHEIRDQILNNTYVDGIFTISDTIGLEVIKTLENNNRKVPEDVKVIGFDGGFSFLNLGKKMTSIAQSPRKLARAINDTINDYYNNQPVESKLIPVSLEIGETT